MKTKKEIKAENFKLLMEKIQKEYSIGKKVFMDTLDGPVTATITEHNGSAFFGSCTVTFDLGGGTCHTQMFTTSILEQL